MSEALAAMVTGMPIATAARTCSFTGITLYYKSCGKLHLECRMGPSTVLSSDASVD